MYFTNNKHIWCMADFNKCLLLLHRIDDAYYVFTITISSPRISQDDLKSGYSKIENETQINLTKQCLSRIPIYNSR